MTDLDALARDVFAAIDAHDLTAVRARLATDCTFQGPGFTGSGADAVTGFMAPFLAAFPDIRHEVVATVSDGDRIAVELDITGTHTAPLASPGGVLPASGRPIRLQAANVWRVADRGITSYRTYFDTATMMAQLTGA